MADPDVDHGFVYTEDGYVDLLASPFFDVRLGLDTTVYDYLERIRHTLVGSIELQLGVFPRTRPADDDDYPLHPSYTALQILYRQPHSSGSSPAADQPSPPRSSPGNFARDRYLC